MRLQRLWPRTISSLLQGIIPKAMATLAATLKVAGEEEEGMAEVAAATVELVVAIGEESRGPRRGPRIPVSERSRKPCSWLSSVEWVE